MIPNLTDLFKANLAKPAWAEKGVTETEIPFVINAIDKTIDTDWRKDDNNNERLLSNSNRN